MSCASAAVADHDAECDGCTCTCHIEAELRERLQAQVKRIPSVAVEKLGVGQEFLIRRSDVLRVLRTGEVRKDEGLRTQIEALRDRWLATKEPWRAERIHAYNDVLALLEGVSE